MNKVNSGLEARLNASNAFLIYSIIKSYKKIEEELRKFLKPFGISLQQYNVLKILRGSKKPISTSVLRERMVQPMTDASRLVERLYLKGWVDKKECRTDKRLVDISISKEGISFLNNVTSTDIVIERLFQKMTQQEAYTLNRLLNKMRS